MAFNPIDAVPYVLAILAGAIGLVYPEYWVLLLVLVAVAVYTFLAPKPLGERELLLAAFFSGAAAHWAAGRSFLGSGLASLSFLPYALWGVALGLSVIWAREHHERAGYAFALGAFALPVAMTPAAFGGRLDALLIAGIFLALGAALAVRLGPFNESRGFAIAKSGLIAALVASLASAVAFLVQVGSAYYLADLSGIWWLYLNLAWYALVPTAVAITGLALLHFGFFSKGASSQRATIAPAVFEEG